jgi:dihydroneopterin aldolase
MDRIILRSMRFEGRLGATDEERELPQLVEVDLEVGDLATQASPTRSPIRSTTARS